MVRWGHWMAQVLYFPLKRITLTNLMVASHDREIAKTRARLELLKRRARLLGLLPPPIPKDRE